MEIPRFNNRQELESDREQELPPIEITEEEAEFKLWLEDHDVRPSRWTGRVFGPPLPVPGPMARILEQDPIREAVKEARRKEMGPSF